MFFYVCGEFIVKVQKCTITPEIKKIHKLYFDCPLGDQSKLWASHVICTACSSGLRDQCNYRKKSIPFAIPMIWREPKDNLTDCYFCKVNVTGHSMKNKHKIVYSQALVQRCSVKKMFLEISQNSQENSCARVSFFDTGDFLCVLRNF